ncbi:MAG: Lrp/AsnC family transcriptional regulator [Candidatus Abyssobacteria bacterium SURF_17]|uniref:Lrp/AsnC family transcriptional regulator n=1 Tax=Candidatus Abyssobacteria bacterium SURF_17 TaxID=2093361 RepID=A0A419EZT4_9BACT|nr:MAG: Lrp/AsnC family transcriptional regulator [Candidatus Abyssubacteria bacterium SURF_17]
MKAYVLLSLVPGLEEKALSQVRATPGVLEVNPVFGHWDTVLIIEADSLDALSRLVVRQIRGIQGVQATETLVAGEI